MLPARRQTVICILGAWLGAACGDLTGTPIRDVPPGDAATRDAMPDADDGSDESRDGRSDEVPDPRYCADTVDWDYAALEERLEDLIKELREGRVRCGSQVHDDLPRVYVARAMRCSARLHSLNMYEHGYFDTRTDGDPGERMTAAGFDHGASAESIVRGDADSRQALQVLEDLRDDPEGCANLTNREFTAIGVGNYAGLWTIDFAAPDAVP